MSLFEKVNPFHLVPDQKIPSDAANGTAPTSDEGVPEPFPLTLVRRYVLKEGCSYKDAVLAVLPKWIKDNPDNDNTTCAVELVVRAAEGFKPRKAGETSVYGMDRADREYQVCDIYQNEGKRAASRFCKEHPPNESTTSE